jgi:1-acyl-sn-glycerol-3-phosphate acyltransferase
MTSRPTLRFRIVAWIVILAVRVARWRVRVEGLEHVPAHGGAVITWNHHSHVDYLLTMLDIYRRLGRPGRYLAKRELWRSPAFGWVPRFADAVPVDRADGEDRDRALNEAVEALRAGDLVLVAPEGGISRSFELQPFRTGAARMAQRAGVPLIPSVGWGSHRLVTTGRRFSPRRAWRIPVTVRYGPPIEVGPHADPVEVTAQLHEVTERMLDEVQRHYPDGSPAGAWWVPARLGGGAPTSTSTGRVRRSGRRASPSPRRPATSRRIRPSPRSREGHGPSSSRGGGRAAS